MTNDESPLVILANVQWPRFGLTAGGAVHALEVARRMSLERNVVVVIPSFVSAEAKREYPDLNFLITPVPGFLRRSTIAVQLLSAVNWLPHRSTLARAPAILSASHFFGDVLPLLAVPAIPAVVIIHHLVEPPWKRRGNFLTNTLHYLAERMSVFLVVHRADAVLVDSESIAARLRDAGLRKPISRTVNAPRGSRVDAPIERDGEMVLSVGRLSPTKGLENLLRAWQLVAIQMPEAHLTIVGGGDSRYVARLSKLAADAQVTGSVTFAGRVNELDKQALLSNASVFAFPSEEEGFGIALAEAMLAGVPCVTFDEPLFDELFPKGRRTAARGDFAGFARAIVDLLRDREQREALARAGRAASARYTWENAAKLDLEAVHSAISMRASKEG